eukprot:RCo000481
MPPSKDWDTFRDIPVPLGTFIHYKQCFERADRDRTGFVGSGDLLEWPQRMGLSGVSVQDLTELIQQVSGSPSGKVDFWEFFAIQLYLTLNLQQTVDLVEFSKFVAQNFCDAAPT